MLGLDSKLFISISKHFLDGVLIIDGRLMLFFILLWFFFDLGKQYEIFIDPIEGNTIVMKIKSLIIHVRTWTFSET